MLENRMVLDELDYIENDEEGNIFELINEECKEFDNWEEENE